MDNDSPNILGDQIPEDVEALFDDEPTPAPEEQPAPEASEEVTEPPAETPVEEPEVPEVPEQPQAEAEPEPEPEPEVPGETAAEAEARKWADKYDTPEKLEEAYRHQVASATRTAQERAQLERELNQVREALTRAKPELEAFQQWKAQQQGQPQPEPQDFDYTDPEQVQAFINAQVQQQLNQHLQQTTQTFEQQQRQLQEQQAFEAKRQEFFQWQAENPDVTPGSDKWTAMNNVIYELQYDPSQGEPVEDNFPLNRESFAIAKTLAEEPPVFEMSKRLQFVPSDDADISLLRDAVSNPALADHLEANPTYLETIKGHSIARQLAGMPQAVSQAQQNAATATQQAVDAQRKAAYVESDSPGTPASAAPGSRADDVADEFDIIGGKVWEQERSILNR